MTAKHNTSDKTPDPQWSAELLGYALGLTDAEENRRIEAAFSNPAELAAARASIIRITAPLDADPEPAIPPNLSDTIMARIDREAGILQFPQSAALAADAEAAGTGGGALLPMRELVGLAAAILLFVGILVPGYRTARNAAQQTMCANNLRMIGAGVAGYAEANSANMPFAGAVPFGASWAPTGQGETGTYSNSKNAYLLVRGRFVSPQAFVDPARPGDFPVSASDIDARDDFRDPRNNSYSPNLVTGPWRKPEFEPEMPIVADMNPMLDDDRKLIREGHASENSRSHAQLDGQNVLRADMGVFWSSTPKVGVDNDDIYRVVGIEKYTGREVPSMRSDAFLVP